MPDQIPNLTTQNRIRAEELFRLAVRAELTGKTANPRTVTTKCNEFLNSAFGLWFLSTIAVGLISFAYAEFSSTQKQIAERQEKISALDSEITGRLIQWEALTRRSTAKTPLEYNAALELLLLPPSATNSQPARIFEVVPANRDRSLVSVLMELYGLVPQSERTELEPLVNYVLNRRWTVPREEGRAYVIVEAMQERFSLRRWGWQDQQPAGTTPPRSP